MKTVLLGINNPQSADPRHVLYPHPPGCAGHRLYTMLYEAAARLNPKNPLPTRAQYLRNFERVNLLDDVVWSEKKAKQRIHEI